MDFFRKLLSILDPSDKRRLVGVVMLITVSVALEAFMLSMVAPATDFVFSPEKSSIKGSLPEFLNGYSQTVLLMIFAVCAAIFVIIKNIFVGFQIRYQYMFSALVKMSVSRRLFERYLTAPYQFHLGRNSSQLIRNVINEVQEFEIRNLLPWMMVTSEVLIASGIVLVLAFLNPMGTLTVALLLLATGVIFILTTRKKLVTLGEVRLENEELRIRSVQQALGGIKEVKLLGLETQTLEHYDVFNKKAAVTYAIQTLFGNIPRLMLEVILIIAVLAVVVVSIASGQSIPEVVGGLGVLGAAALRLIPSASRIISALSMLKFGTSALDNIKSELALTFPESELLEEKKSAHRFSVFEKEIKVEDLTFQYEAAESPVLDGASLLIPRNSFVGIIGESGSGKSTLVDLLLGLLSPSGGAIQVDGVSIQENMESWQSLLSYVPQQIYMADLSIRENVAFGVPPDSISDERVWEALKLAQVDEFVSTLEGGILTEVGERGVRLSGGQCQRIGIARALYRDPEVIVFDEATSALDDESQAKVMKAIRSLKGSRTIIMISHRLSTIDYCDVVYEVLNGKCLERSAEIVS